MTEQQQKQNEALAKIASEFGADGVEITGAERMAVVNAFQNAKQRQMRAKYAANAKQQTPVHVTGAAARF